MIGNTDHRFRPMIGVVTGSSGTSPGPASGITYDIFVPVLGQEWTSVEPTQRPYTDDIDITKAPNGAFMLCVWDGDKLHVDTLNSELPDPDTDCDA